MLALSRRIALPISISLYSPMPEIPPSFHIYLPDSFSMEFSKAEKNHPRNGNRGVSTLHHASSSRAAIETESNFAAHNYKSVPVVLSHGQGASVWDPEGRHYLDFHSASTALNHGHCHPKLVAALIEQASRLTLSSRAFHNDVMPQFAEMVTRYFGYEMALPMNTGAETSETAIKIARKWGYKVKGIPPNQAIVLGAAGNHHGRTVSFFFSCFFLFCSVIIQ